MKQLSEFPHVRCWLTERLSEQVRHSLIRLASLPDLVRMAVMPDVHLATDVCVGVVLATSQNIYPDAVGSDIGCGMLAIRFNAERELIDNESAAARVLQGFYRRIPVLKHSRDGVPAELPQELTNRPLSHPALEKLKAREGCFQLGTHGRGNHFVELQSDDENQLWLLLHSGSRGMGQAITTHHCRIAQSNPLACGLVSLKANSPEGEAYFRDQEWARAYAASNRLAMLESIQGLLRDLFQIETVAESLIHTNHNHVQRELHLGQQVWIHRKGAQSATDGELGIIPGSMGTVSCHVEGRGCPDSLNSSSHGAGRRLSRTDAAKTISASRLRRELRTVWFDEQQAASFCDESPSAYRDLRQVMEAQTELTKTVRRLRPILSYKR